MDGTKLEKTNDKKTKHSSTWASFEARGLCVRRRMDVLGRREPSSIEREIVERYVGWSRVDGLPGAVLAAGIRDVHRVRESKIRLRRGAHTDAAAKLDVLVLRNFEFGLVEVECWIDLLQQFLDLLLEETVLALPHVRVDDIAVLVDQVTAWPALVVNRLPDFVA